MQRRSFLKKAVAGVAAGTDLAAALVAKENAGL